MWVLEQKGVRLFVQCARAGTIKRGSYLNQSWAGALSGTVYPYASAPVRKLSQVVTAPAKGKKVTFVNLVTATGGKSPPYRSEARIRDGLVSVSGAMTPGIRFSNDRLRLSSSAKGLDIALDQDWRLPADLQRGMFGPCGPRSRRK
jgi:hypothetical protein